MSDRIEHFIRLVLDPKNNGKWIRVKKLKTQHINRLNTEERNRTINGVVEACKLMGMPIERERFRIRLFKEMSQ